MYLSIYIYLCIYLSIYLSFYLYLYPSVFLFIIIFVYLCIAEPGRVEFSVETIQPQANQDSKYRLETDPTVSLKSKRSYSVFQK